MAERIKSRDDVLSLNPKQLTTTNLLDLLGHLQIQNTWVLKLCQKEHPKTYSNVLKEK